MLKPILVLEPRLTPQILPPAFSNPSNAKLIEKTKTFSGSQGEVRDLFATSAVTTSVSIIF
jgi:hypothetical protein